MKPIFKNAKIVSSNVDGDVYRRQVEGVKRGDKQFVMSRSDLMEFHLCPHRWIGGYKDSGETKSTLWGSMIDCLILTPSKFQEQFVIEPETYTRKAMECPKCQSVSDSESCSKCKTKRVPVTIEKPWSNNALECKNWAAQQEGRQIITKADCGKAFMATSKLQLTEGISEVLAKSDKQVLVVGTYVDPETGIEIPVKALIDIVPNKTSVFRRMLFDFKTSRSANPLTWNRHVYENDYHVQGAFHMDLFNAATDEERIDFCHIVQENFEPFEVLTPIPLLSSEFMDAGRFKYQAALRKYAQCLVSGEWPSYAPLREQIDGFQIIQPLPWMVSDLANEIPTMPRLERTNDFLSEFPS